MNFDDIKQAMENDSADFTVPLSVSEIKSSHSSLRKLKKCIRSELWANLSMAILLFLQYFNLGDHELAQTLFKYTAFISILSLIGFITLQIKLLRKLTIDDTFSRKIIERFLIQIKSYYEVSKYITTGLASSVFIPIFIANISKHRNEQYITDYLTLNLSTTQVLSQIGWILFLSSLVFFLGNLLFKLYPKKEIKKLERTLEHF